MRYLWLGASGWCPQKGLTRRAWRWCARVRARAFSQISVFPSLYFSQEAKLALANVKGKQSTATKLAPKTLSCNIGPKGQDNRLLPVSRPGRNLHVVTTAFGESRSSIGVRANALMCVSCPAVPCMSKLFRKYSSFAICASRCCGEAKV